MRFFNRGSRSLLITTLASGCGSSTSASVLVGASCNTRGGEKNPRPRESQESANGWELHSNRPVLQRNGALPVDPLPDARA